MVSCIGGVLSPATPLSSQRGFPGQVSSPPAGLFDRPRHGGAPGALAAVAAWAMTTAIAPASMNRHGAATVSSMGKARRSVLMTECGLHSNAEFPAGRGQVRATSFVDEKSRIPLGFALSAGWSGVPPLRSPPTTGHAKGGAGLRPYYRLPAICRRGKKPQIGIRNPVPRVS